MASQPTLVVFAGVNGAGKSTFYQSGLWRECDIDSRMPRINPDEIIVAAGKDWSSPTDQLWAGKQAVGQVHVEHVAVHPQVVEDDGERHRDGDAREEGDASQPRYMGGMQLAAVNLVEQTAAE